MASWTPVSWHHPLWAESGASSGAISLDPAATLTALMRLLAYGGVFWLALQVGRDRNRARNGLKAVAILAIIQAAYGLALYFIGSDTILWFQKWAYIGDVTGTFVNRNAFGAYAGLGLLACLAVAAGTMAEERGRRRGARDTAELLLNRTAPYLVGLGLLGTALLLSHSRGAFLATAVAILFLLALFGFGRLLSARVAWGLTTITLLVGGLAVAVSGEATLTRLAESTEIQGDRGQLYRLSLNAIAEAPLMGHGYGAFEQSFRLYRDTSLPRPVIYDFAHNIHLEVLVGLGIPGAMLLYAAILIPLSLCLKGVITRQRDKEYSALALAAAVLLAGHGLVDFSLQIPAIAVLFAFLLGLGVAQSWSRSVQA
ncbi:O-antigen ligase family protein [Lacibacterium aquatile]|uniref:O-antigen ligase family protein n=1 Tax=Lacibacterium aquatile TaxID=1168082 RepID=A0ABW5DW60_9PROT